MQVGDAGMRKTLCRWEFMQMSAFRQRGKASFQEATCRASTAAAAVQLQGDANRAWDKSVPQFS